LCPPPPSTLFPYTTLFRSIAARARDCPGVRAVKDHHQGFFPFKIVASVVGARVMRDLEADSIARQIFRQSRGDHLQNRKDHGTKDRKSTRLNSSHVSISYA